MIGVSILPTIDHHIEVIQMVVVGLIHDEVNLVIQQKA